jgi:hypothetical protein
MSEDTNTQKTPAEEKPVNSRATPISADDLIANDTDAPVADNRVPPPEAKPEEFTLSNEAPNVNPPPSSGTGKKRGRPKLTDEERAARAAQKANAMPGAMPGAPKPPPDFSDLGKATGGALQPSQPARPPRDYYAEACNLFFPVSFACEKWLGPHWGVPIVEREIEGLKRKTLEPTDEQKAYLSQMARWLEYEQFPELNARYGFIIASVGYAAPKMKTSPTPERLKAAWDWIRVKILRKKQT